MIVISAEIVANTRKAMGPLGIVEAHPGGLGEILLEFGKVNGSSCKILQSQLIKS